MDHRESVIPIVFIRDSRQASIESADLKPVRDYVDQDDRAGVEEVITFLAQYRQPE